jgi:hypothetical protein
VRETGDIVSLMGLDSRGAFHTSLFDELSQGKGYITKDDIKTAIRNDALNGSYYTDTEMSAFTYMRDNFGKVADYSVDPNNKTVNPHSLLQAAKKQHVDVPYGSPYQSY